MKIVTLNFWGLEPPLDKRLELAIRQLRALDPDVVCLQEVQPMSGARTTAHAIADGLGMHANYAKACDWPDGAWGPGSNAGEQGLASVARAPLAETEVLALPDPRPGDVRILLSGKVGDIWVHSTHLHYKLDDGLARERQVLAIAAALRARRDTTRPPQLQ